MPYRLSAARYGKDNVRVLKVARDSATGVQTVTEMTVCCLLEGDIDASYTHADNKVVVATDSIKNTIYILARQHAVNPPELFAATVGSHFVDTYAHINAASVSVIVHRWLRMDIAGQSHPHSFIKDAGETRTAQVCVRRSQPGSSHGAIDLSSSISGLSVLKTTGSAFHGFIRDEYTTLPETWDRILATDVDATWHWKPFANLNALQQAKHGFDDAWQAARDITLRLFANDESPSVQNTMYKMCEQVLDAVPGIQDVAYSLPNKHNFELDLTWHKNLHNTGQHAEVYVPQSNPNGLIKCQVSRS
ncbi:hypothetical protein CDD81_3360 [Ophiocordyceps australis]|uniref:Uricase n=1 Tax=Ophiocordyceps australis TaxID=1399860 RepID=A0A2C5XV88_9HYPO|nr:hypothetical protein CDD81_3360 [Ophiocordyceps australis]